MLDIVKSTKVNGIDVDALKSVIADVAADPAKGVVAFAVRSAWNGQTRSETTVDGYTIGGQRIDRAFKIKIDEPFELCGANTAPNPQEMLMAALNACMMVGYVANAALRGITLDLLEVETEGALDLRGFLGLDDSVRPGYDAIKYRVRIKGNGTAAEFEEIHQAVMKTSPNYFNISKPIRLESKLEVVA